MNPGDRSAGGSTFDQTTDAQPSLDDGSGTGNTIGISDVEFEIFEWFPAHQSCQKYFLDHAQHDYSIQAVATLINIRLPFQWQHKPVRNYSNTFHASAETPATFPAPSQPRQDQQPPLSSQGHGAWISLLPYIRRLVVTGFDKEAVLHGFFGDDWRKGIGPLQECERRNYMFAAKSGGWMKVKAQYDMNPEETVPFLQPPQGVMLAEIENAEKLWSQWLAMEDWMIGPRMPDGMGMYARSDGQSRHAGPSSSS